VLKGDSKKIKKTEDIQYRYKKRKFDADSACVKKKQKSSPKKSYWPKPFAPSQKSIIISFSFISLYVCIFFGNGFEISKKLPFYTFSELLQNKYFLLISELK
jgi:hypothetical protein